MFDISSSELLLLGAVAVAVIPPKDLPRAMRFVGQWIGKARGMTGHFRAGLDEMIRQAELDDIEKKWRDENERIMTEHPFGEVIEQPPESPVTIALPASVSPPAIEASRPTGAYVTPNQKDQPALHPEMPAGGSAGRSQHHRAVIEKSSMKLPLEQEPKQ